GRGVRGPPRRPPQRVPGRVGSRRRAPELRRRPERRRPGLGGDAPPATDRVDEPAGHADRRDRPERPPGGLPMNRVLAAARLHLVHPLVGLGVPWLVGGISFAMNWLIWHFAD